MGSISRNVLLGLALVMTGCDLDDDDAVQGPGFIFRCGDARGCGHSDQDVIPGDGYVFGPVDMNRDFSLYYGVVNGDSWGDAGGLYFEDIEPEEGVEIISSSPERLYAGPPFRATASGRTAVIAMKNGKVVDYMYIDARPSADLPRDTDADTGEDTGEDTGGDTGEDTEVVDAGDTETGDAGDGTDDTGVETAGDSDQGDTDTATSSEIGVDTESETIPMDSDGTDTQGDGGLDSEEPDGGPDGGVDAGVDDFVKAGRPAVRRPKR